MFTIRTRREQREMMKMNNFALILSLQLSLLVIVNAQPPVEVKVGVVLNTESIQGKLELTCINMAISDFYAAHPQSRTRIVLHVRDSRDDVVVAAAAVVDLVKNVEVAAIIGPETSPQAQFVINVGERAQVPIISFSATSPFLSPLQNPYFVRATQDDSSQVQALSALVQAFGWRQVVPIHVNNEFGDGIVPSLVEALQQIGTRILYRSVIPSIATDDQIAAELYRLKSLQTRVFIVHMTGPLAQRLFMKAQQLGMISQDYVWIITNSVANVLNLLDHQVIQSMHGILGVKTYVPKTRELERFIIRWKIKFIQQNPGILNPQMNVYGLWAYDAATALGKAVEKVGITNVSFHQARISTNLSTDLSTFRVSQVGPSLLRVILHTKFRGLSGNFVLVDGQLQSSIFQLVNVKGNREQEIGFWTLQNGLIRKLTSTNTKYSTTKANLGAIVWPGNSTSVPQGWVVSPNGKKLQIGVPVKDGFSEFVKVIQDPTTNRIEVQGFCIDVFNAVIAKLPYSVPIEYMPFAKSNGEPAGTYDELIYQVYEQNYDAVVGDTTIRANRSLYVDFTLPYTESGVVMIAPLQDEKEATSLIFLKPLTPSLWFTTFCSFVFIAFVIWLLEHRINEDFRGPPWHQIGTSLYHSFSIMVFSHSFKVFNNLTRFVVIVWIFVVLVLIQSYTANLASLLTVQQLQPTFTDIKELIKRGEPVGYQEGSFVRELLKQMNFSDKQLKSFDSTDHLHELLTKGANNEGIMVAFDEIPYVKVFLAKYCSKYTMVPPTYKTDGLAFVFPIGSPLVSDVSRAVLNVTEGEEMSTIENKWFKHHNSCPDSSSSSTSSIRLGIERFWVLFTIAGIAVVFATIIYLVRFLREYNYIWANRAIPAQARIRRLFNIFCERDLNDIAL